MHSRDASRAGNDRSDRAVQAERMLRIRRRVADGVYNHPSVVAHLARCLVDGGELL